MILPISFYNKTAYNIHKAASLGFRGAELHNTPAKNDAGPKEPLNGDVFEKRENPKINPPKRGQILIGNEIFCRQSTYFFRRDIDWKNFSKYLQKRFENTDKVNTYCYGCSRGDEAYSLSITLQQFLGEESEKFFPIFAKDINETTIERNILRQKNGRKTLSGYLSTKFALGLSQKEVEEFIKPDGCIQCGEMESTLTEKTTKPVKFSCANILDDIENIDTSRPSVVMMRNMWPYINKDEYESFTKRLYEILPKGSVVVIGEYDYKGETGLKASNAFPNYLLEAGFEPAKNCAQTLRKRAQIIFEKN